MRYFLLKDEISPDGDTYRWDGTSLQFMHGIGEWGEPDHPGPGETIEEYMNYLSGPYGAWEEIEVP